MELDEKTKHAYATANAVSHVKRANLEKFFLVFELTVEEGATTLSAARVKSTATTSSHLWKNDLKRALSTPVMHTDYVKCELGYMVTSRSLKSMMTYYLFQLRSA